MPEAETATVPPSSSILVAPKMNRFDYIPEIRWNKKTGEISFTDTNGTQWRGKGTVRILKQTPDGVGIELRGIFQGVVK